MSPDFRKFLCTTHVSDGFLLVLGDQNTFWPCLKKNPVHFTIIVFLHDEQCKKTLPLSDNLLN